MIKRLFHGFPNSSDNLRRVELERVTCNGCHFTDKLHIDVSKNDANNVLLVEVLATASRNRQSSRLCPRRGGTEDRCIRSVEFLEQLGSFGTEHIPKPGDFRFDILNSNFDHWLNYRRNC